MRHVLLAATAMTMAALCAPAVQATSFLNGATVSLDRTDDFSWTTVYQASAGNGLAGTTGAIRFNFLNANAAGTVWNFSYSVDNTSTAQSAGSELSSFGFDVSTRPVSVSTGTTDLFSATLNAGNFNGLGTRDLCFYAGPNCNGGASRGITASQAPAAGTFSLTFSTGVNTLLVDDFVARWQSTGSNRQGSASGSGTPSAPAVPEAGTWAMMLVGFGVVGAAARSRRARAIPGLSA